MSTVIFTRQGDGYGVRFRYDPALVELLKTAVPSYARSWDPSLKQWQVQATHARQLASALRRTGHQVIGCDADDPPPRTTTGTDPSQWAHILFRRVGPTRREPVFRALTRIFHPDLPTGDGRLQQELNAAREELDR